MSDDTDLLQAKALAGRTRRNILRVLRSAERDWTASEMAAELSLHRTSVAHHLAIMRDAGLVTESTLAPTGRGRPRLGYRLVVAADRADVDGPHESAYRSLASMLAETVATGRPAHEVGVDTGRRLMSARTSTQVPTVDMLIDEMDRMGFAPELRRRRGRIDVILRECPFAHVAAERPEIVCALHEGIAVGLVDDVAGLEVERLEPAHPRRAGCRLLLRSS